MVLLRRFSVVQKFYNLFSVYGVLRLVDERWGAARVIAFLVNNVIDIVVQVIYG